jgi:uncharacterized protein YndB with AHSA1/START domain
VDGTCEVRLTRYYNEAPEKVWAALTEPESLARWLAPAGEFDLSPGGSFEFRLQGGETLTGRVRAVEPERLLELDWVDSGEKPSVVRFQLTGESDGTVLVLDHRRVDASIGMRSIARWQYRFARLDALVERRAVRT